MPATRDYHDFVIKDGRFVGQFEEMYRACDDPWQQSDPSAPASVLRHTTIGLLQRHGVRSVVEYGCGLGYFTEQLDAAGFTVHGIDVSHAAIEKARQRRPDLCFTARDVLTTPFERADVILFAELAWYVLPHLPSLWARMARESGARYFVNVLGFPAHREYGLDMVPDLDALIRWCPFPCVDVVTHRNPDEDWLGTVTVYRVV